MLSLHREEVVVAAVVEDVVVDPHVGQHEVAHPERALDLPDGREENVLHQLQIAVVADREIGGQQGDLVGQRLQAVAAAAHDLEDVGILFVGQVNF